MKYFYKRLFLIDHLGMMAILLFGEGVVVESWYSKQIGTALALGLSFIALLFVFLLAKEVIKMDPLIHIKDYCAKEGFSIHEIESDFDIARKIGVRLREGNKWIYYMDKNGEPDLILKTDIVYMDFIAESRGKYSTTFLAAYNSKGEVTKVPMSKKKFKKIRSHQDNSLLMNTFYQDRFRSKEKSAFAAAFYSGAILMVIAIGFDKMYIAAAIIVITVVTVIVISSRQKKCSFDKINDYCQLYGYSIEQLKEEFPSAVERGKNVRESRDWIYFINTEGKPDVIRKERVTHTEYHGRCLYVYDVEHKLTKIPMCKRKADSLQIHS